MDFGKAIESLKEGKKITRREWDNKSVFIILSKGSFDFNSHPIRGGIGILTGIEGINPGLFEPAERGSVRKLPNISLHNIHGSIVPCWAASHADILADDWLLLNNIN